MRAGGADYVWFVIAERLGGRTVAEWKATMTHTEYLQWQERLFSPEANNEPTKIDWGLAEIAHQIYLLPYTFFGNKQNAKLAEVKDFLVTFKNQPTTSPVTTKASREAIAASWEAWAEAIFADSGDSSPRPAS